MVPISGSASEAAVFAAAPVRLAAVPGAGRVGGLFKLDPAVPDLNVEQAGARDAVVDARAVLDAAAGRFAAAPVVLAVGRRGGTGSVLLEGADILLRAVVVDEVLVREGEGDEGDAVAFEASAGCSAGVEALAGASTGSAAGGGASSIRYVQKRFCGR
ncbi:hypothetical protein BDV96DRAFT_644779 [Lophiotrema nucula]|uniref:Uncharacterized protein n=1 Tax=Lophiotrema nucula TaxID=690887 RepID=A0A6A5ZDU1_9PLEO|nr:hypothetical protein BDV96DRAFT_644779 [Lophiotrema nucula]